MEIAHFSGSSHCNAAACGTGAASVGLGHLPSRNGANAHAGLQQLVLTCRAPPQQSAQWRPIARTARSPGLYSSWPCGHHSELVKCRFPVVFASESVATTFALAWATNDVLASFNAREWA
ncbi:MAG TPA: hypothetical protein VM425_10685 [Myxococcota bacterium]|nr:hypothetical protein [Myxococcota bacterium]